jgi:hypothetical protein
MSEALFSKPMFRFSVMQSLAAIVCLGCLFTFGVECSLHVATAAASFVYCSLGDFSSLGTQA